MSAFIPLHTRLCLAGIFFVLSAGTAASQQSSTLVLDSGNLTIKRTVHNVVVDIVVSGPDRRPLTGFSREDFDITEDGIPQQVLSFESHEFSIPNAVLAARDLGLPANTYANVPSVPERGPLNIILYDMLNTSTADQVTARAALLKFIRSKPSGSRFAVFLLYNNLEMIQGFTDNQSQLLSVLDSRKTWPRPEANGTGRDLYVAFLKIAQFVGGLPGRKNLIWMSGSFPTSFMSSHADENGNNDDAIRAVANTLTRGQIAVYPVDVHGLVGSTATGNVGDLYRAYASEDEIADATGGHAIYSSNDMTKSLFQAIEEGSTYYTLSYSPTNQKYDGRLRKIHVKLSKQGYSLAYRHSYFGDDPDSPSRVNPQLSVDTLNVNMQHGAPQVQGVLFRAHIHALGAPVRATPTEMTYVSDPATASAGHKGQQAKVQKPILLQPYSVDYNVPAIQFEPAAASGEGEPDALQFSVAAYDGNGQMIYSITQRALTDLDEGSSVHRRRYRVEQEIHIPTQSSSLRISVCDPATGRIGALEVNLPLKPEPELTENEAGTGQNGSSSSTVAYSPKAN
jgi:VWFA-related protein